jgi:hypothetical protein
MNVSLGDELLFIEGSSSFLLVGKAQAEFSLCIEMSEDEICQTVEPDDLIAVSAPEGGSLRQAWMLLELVRTYHMPLVVLSRNHPGSRRLRMVVSAGPEVLLSCGIVRGTHPEQHLICASDELSGMRILGVNGGVVIEGAPEEIQLRHLKETDLSKE